MQTPHFRLLSDDQIETIVWAAHEILRRTGVDVLEPQARDLLKSAGVPFDGVRFWIPTHLLDWAARTAPSRVVMCNSRTGAPAMHLEGTKAYYGTGSDTIAVIDLDSGERRKPTKADVGDFARVADALPHIDFVMSMGSANDVPEGISDLHHFEAMVLNTGKPIIATAWNEDNLKDIVAMAAAVAGGEEAHRKHPFLIMYSEPVSPLQMGLEPTQKIVYSALKGVPVICGTGKVGGATCPVTIAGALAQGTAEALTGVLIAQLAREGSPVIFGGERLQMDMATTVGCYGAPEFFMSVAANAEIATWLGLPSWSYAGCSDAKVFDQQAAAEGTMMSMLAGLSGGNLNHDVGYLESGLTSSFEGLVYGNEVIGAIKRILRGIEVDAETLALEVIDKVGPGGEFLTTEHTFRHFRTDWFPTVSDRQNFDEWRQAGSSTLGQRANAEAKRLLAEHEPVALPEETRTALAAIIERAAARSEE